MSRRSCSGGRLKSRACRDARSARPRAPARSTPSEYRTDQVYWEDRATEDAGNEFFIKLVKAPKGRGVPKHPRGYYVQTFYPI